MAESRTVDLSIIIVYYESFEVIRKCLETIYESDFDREYEVVIVDNASPDRRSNELHDPSRRTLVHRSVRNLGFGGGCNLGLRHARGRYILFLNPDILLERDTLSNMLHFMDEIPDCGLSTCSLRDESGSLQRYSLLQEYTLRRLLYDLFYLYKLPGLGRLFAGTAYPLERFSRRFSPDVISGAFMLFREETVRRLGGFDPDFFLYGEDTDLSWRARRMTKVLYFPEVSCLHIGHTTLGSGFSTKKYTLLFDSRLRFLRKHQGRIQTVIYASALLLAGFVQYLPSLLMSPRYGCYLRQRSRFFVRFVPQSRFGLKNGVDPRGEPGMESDRYHAD